MFFVSHFTITWHRIPKFGTHDAFINSYVESKFHFSRFYHLLVTSKSILICRNSQNKNKGITRSREVPITERLIHYTFMWKLTANNFYQPNCVDLNPVPIIRFIFQFGFRIVWDSDPSGFGILKCPSLVSVHGIEWKMEWNRNFGMEYKRSQNKMEDFKNGMEGNLPYFHTYSIVDFAHGSYRKIYTDSDN